MDTETHRQRLVSAGFTDQQAGAILDVVHAATADLVTKDYLHKELLRFKRSMLLWIVVMLAPIYAWLIYLTMRLGL